MSKFKIIGQALLIGVLGMGALAAVLDNVVGIRITGWQMLAIAVPLCLVAGLYLARRGSGAADVKQVKQTKRAEPEVELDPARLARLTSAARANVFVDLPEAHDEGPGQPDDVIAKALARPIVFRQTFPPTADPGLSFYGGRPIGPATLEWPHHASDTGAAPLSFVMQWDCRELAAQDATGLLPCDGALYFFADLNWGHKDAFRFVHAPGDGAHWAEIEPPADLKPLFGAETAWQVPWCSSQVAPEFQDCPTLLPRWPFRPAAFDYPADRGDDPDESRFWSDRAAGEAMVAVQAAMGAPLASYDPKQPSRTPFPGFPHDWAAVRIVCSKVLDTLRSPIHSRLPDTLQKLEGEAREARIAEWRDEATELYQFAAAHPLTGAVPADLSAQIRDWMDKVNGCFSYSLAIEKSVNASLGLGSRALAAIPPDLIARASHNHALGLAYDRDEYRREFEARCCQGLDQQTSDAKWNEAEAAGTLPKVRVVHAPSPNRIFGPASYVQGGVEELIDDHLLLLEISSSSPIGIELGEGVIQYLIRPADLAEGRFDRAVVVMSAY